RQVQDREGRADAHRLPARTAARRAEGAARLSHRVQPHGDEIFQEHEGRDRVPALGAQEGELREVVYRAEGVCGRPHARVGKAPDVEQRPGDEAVPDRAAAAEAADGLRWRAQPESYRVLEQV